MVFYPPRKKKETTRSIGDFGEQAAVDYLTAQGYAICERNYVVRPYEIDIIAQDGDSLVFVEVKTRANDVRPEQVLNKSKQMYVMRAAMAYSARFNRHFKIRFDAIFIIGSKTDYKINHIRNAFVPRIKTYS